jgi:hypothetical protein
MSPVPSGDPSSTTRIRCVPGAACSSTARAAATIAAMFSASS